MQSPDPFPLTLTSIALKIDLIKLINWLKTRLATITNVMFGENWRSISKKHVTTTHGRSLGMGVSIILFGGYEATRHRKRSTRGAQTYAQQGVSNGYLKTKWVHVHWDPPKLNSSHCKCYLLLAVLLKCWNPLSDSFRNLIEPLGWRVL